ncbi:MAG: hypothetical protein IH849_12715 [Acidobacteria bacterium]|nr:hypothetical protein [Acidobacteriota bacterium]
METDLPDQEAPPPLLPVAAQLLDGFDQTLLAEAAALVEQELSAGPPVNQETLIKLLGAQGLMIKLSWTYFVIFGSQIRALQMINARPDGLPAEELRPLYDAASEHHSEFYQTFSAEQWLAFFSAYHVATITEGKLFITSKGRAFLAFLVQQNLTFEKAG